MTEKEYAEMEGKHNGISERYFLARPELDNPTNRKIFQDGFYRAYKLFTDFKQK